MRPSIRRWVQHRIGQCCIGNAEHESQQASLSSLFSGLGEEGALERAESQFRLLPFDTIADATDVFMLPGDIQHQQSLRLRTINAAFQAEMSVCISHSWRDDRQCKWDALSSWAEGRTYDTGYTPLLWLDAACIATDRDSDALELLPLFTAGCQHFLMLAGATYTKRLWTVMELFIFLRMGGDVERVIIRPVLSPEDLNASQVSLENRARARFEEFDVRNARCSKAADRQRLLTCIEAGFGAHTPFNEMVKRILSKQDDYGQRSRRSKKVAPE